MALFYPLEEMGQTEEKKKVCFLTAAHCVAWLEGGAAFAVWWTSVIYSYVRKPKHEMT